MSREFTVSLRDSLGGVRLEDVTLTSWTCTDSSIRNLDIWRAPQLEELDLSQLPEGVHLTLVDCPRLKRLYLPDHQASVIHLDVMGYEVDTLPPLMIEGGVEQVDSCWSGGTFMVEAPEGQAWKGVLITSSASLLEWVRTQACQPSLLLVRGQSPETTLDLAIEGVQELHWVAPLGLQQLKLNGDVALQRLQLTQAQQLEKLKVMSSLQEIRLNFCPSLHTLQAASQVTNLHQVGATKFSLKGQAGQLFVLQPSCIDLAVEEASSAEFNLSDQLKQVDLPFGCEVTCLGRVPASLRKTARVHVNESTVLQLLDEYKQGDHSVAEDLESLLPFMSSSHQLPVSLRLLHSLLEAGASPQWIWDLRMKISARHLGEARSKKRQSSTLRQVMKPNWLVTAKQNWRWVLPKDLGQDAWILDWKIWMACRDVQGVRKYGALFSEVMISSTIDAGNTRLDESGRSLHFNQWLLHWLNSGDLADMEVQHLAAKVLKRLKNIEMPLSHFSLSESVEPHLPSRTLLQVERFLESLEERGELLACLREYLVSSLMIRELLSYLQGYLQRQPQEARQLILRLAVKPAEYWLGRGTSAQMQSMPRQLRVLALTGQLVKISAASAT